jgi:hypothetical protein
VSYLFGGVDEVASRPSQWFLAFPEELEFSFQNKEVLILPVVCVRRRAAAGEDGIQPD